MKKEHSKFMVRCLCIALIPLVLFTVYCSFFKMNYMDAEYPMFKAQKEYISKVQDNSLLILGDSRAKAGFIPNVIGEGVYNLALGGATPIEMYYSLRNYLRNSPPPEKVIIAFAPQHFYRCDCFWERSVYFGYFSPRELNEIMRNAKSQGSPLYYDAWKYDALQYYTYMPSKYGTAMYASIFEDRLSKNKGTFDSVTNALGYKIYGRENGSSELNFEAYEKSFYVDSLTDMYFRMIIELCESENISVYVEQIPMNESSYDALEKSYISEYENYMHSISESYPQIFVDEKLSYMDDKYFGDSSHLNKAGAVVFSSGFSL